ncbi:lysozyme, partial [Pseudomonas aeruginosa]
MSNSRNRVLVAALTVSLAGFGA